MKSNRAPDGAMVVRRTHEASSLWDDVRLQKLWLGVERRGWRSLAVLAASHEVDTLLVSELLAQLAWRYRGQPSTVCDLRDLSMRLVEYQVRELQGQIDAGTRVVISLRSLFDNPTAALVARNADAVILCLGLGTTLFKAAEHTIDEIGRERLVGAILMREPSKSKQAGFAP